MSRIAEELNWKAIKRGVAGPYTSWWRLFEWNILRDFYLFFSFGCQDQDQGAYRQADERNLNITHLNRQRTIVTMPLWVRRPGTVAINVFPGAWLRCNEWLFICVSPNIRSVCRLRVRYGRSASFCPWNAAPFYRTLPIGQRFETLWCLCLLWSAQWPGFPDCFPFGHCVEIRSIITRL